MSVIAGGVATFKIGTAANSVALMSVQTIEKDDVVRELVDTHGLGDTVRTVRLSNVLDNGSLTIEYFKDKTSAGHLLIESAVEDSTEVFVEVGYPDGSKNTGNGYVVKYSTSGMEKGDPNNVTVSAEIKLNAWVFVVGA